MDTLLSVRDLDVSFLSYRGIVHALQGVNVDLNYGETVGLVGETGCGKSTLGLSIVGLIPHPGIIERGEIYFKGEDLLKKSEEEMRIVRREDMSMIFQDPTTSLNPVFRVGDQIAEGVMLTNDINKKEAMARTIELLSMVRIPSPNKVARQYPHEFSGGMKQRAMIAMALSHNPKLLIADEPTSSLDVTIQAQILELMKKVQKNMGMTVLLITHDMGVIAQTCDRVVVMYAGNIVEIGTTNYIFKKTCHPYSQGLIASVALHEKEGILSTIPGSVPDLIEIPPGCPFNPRCKYVKDKCKKIKPKLYQIDPSHLVACHLEDEL
jgi:oligopeptide/dipeptide ABC transporter ATP-binding protein